MLEDPELIWERVCVLREELGKSLVQISKDSGVPLTSVKRFFNGVTKNPGFLSLCQIINALGASVDEVLEIDREKQPLHMESDCKYTRHLEKDLHYERKSKVRWQIIFLVLVSLNILLLLLDIFRPETGSIRYQQQMAGCAGRAAWEMLCRVFRTVKGVGGL